MIGRVRLRSPYDPIAAARRLKDVIGDKPTPDGITGHGDETRMVLQVVAPGRQSGGFDHCFTARVKAKEGGALIVGRFGLSRHSRQFCLIWFSFLSLFIAIGLLIAVAADEWVIGGGFILIPLLMMGMVAYAVVAGKRGRRDKEARILDFLKRTIRAERL